MKRLLLYPMQFDYMPLFRFAHMHDYHISSAIAPQGWGVNGKDACTVDNGSVTRLTVTDDYESALPGCDSVLLDDDGLSAESLQSKYELAKDSSKEIFVTQGLAKKLSLNESQILSYPALMYTPSPHKIHKIPVPVVTVMGLGGQCDKFGLQLMLREHFIKQGYKVSQLGSSIYSPLFGFPALCDVFPLSFEDKVYALNYHIMELAERETPDVIIIGVPGGIMPLNEHNTFHFGEMALAMSHAATPDVSVLSLYHIEATVDYIDTYKQYCRYRLGMETEYFHMSNTMVYIDQNHETEYDLIKLKQDAFLPVYERLKKEDTDIFNVYHKTSRTEFLLSVIQQLQGFPDVV